MLQSTPKEITQNLVVVVKGPVKPDLLRSRLPSPNVLFQPHPKQSFRPALQDDLNPYRVPISDDFSSTWYPAKAPSQGELLLARLRLRRMFSKTLRLIFLIDTLGGNIKGFRNAQETTEVVRKARGSVAAFGGKDVASAGALLLTLADREMRYLLPHSNLFFHEVNITPADDSPFTDEDRQKAVDHYWKYIQDFLTSNASETMQRVMPFIFEISDIGRDFFGERQMTFPGFLADQMGLATSVVSLREKFETFLGIKRKTYTDSSIEDFFQEQEAR